MMMKILRRSAIFTRSNLLRTFFMGQSHSKIWSVNQRKKVSLSMACAAVVSAFLGGSANAAGLEAAAKELAVSTLSSTQGDVVLAYQQLQYLEHTVPHCYDAELLNGYSYVWKLFDRAGWIVMEDDAVRALRADGGAAQAAKAAKDLELCPVIVEIYEYYIGK